MSDIELSDSDKEQWRALYAAGGQLFFHFAALETYLSGCLRFNLTWKIDVREWKDRSGFAAAVFGSQRFKASRDTVKRIVREEGKLSVEQLSTLDEIMAHFGHIAALRDKLAHQHTIKHPEQPETWLISDVFSTRNLRARQTWLITTQDIRDATYDLHFGREALGDPVGSGTLLIDCPTEQPTWRYKPTALELLHPEKANALRSQMRLSQSYEV